MPTFGDALAFLASEHEALEVENEALRRHLCEHCQEAALQEGKGEVAELSPTAPPRTFAVDGVHMMPHPLDNDGRRSGDGESGQQERRTNGYKQPETLALPSGLPQDEQDRQQLYKSQHFHGDVRRSRGATASREPPSNQLAGVAGMRGGTQDIVLKNSGAVKASNANRPEASKGTPGPSTTVPGSGRTVVAMSLTSDSGVNSSDTSAVLSSNIGNFNLSRENQQRRPPFLPESAEDYRMESQDGVESDVLAWREFRLHACWDIKDEELCLFQPRGQAFNDTVAALQTLQRRKIFQPTSRWGSRKQGCNLILYPQSSVRLFWDLVGVCMVAYDLIMTPLHLMTCGQEAWTIALDVVVNAFWTLDILLTFRTGFYMNGKLVMDAKSICKEYVTTWLLFDIIVVLPEWVHLAAQFTESVQEGLLQMRTLRLIRFMRLLRLVKLKRLSRDLICRINSNFGLSVLKMVIWVIGIMGMAHLIACFWYGIGDVRDGWVGAWHAHSDFSDHGDVRDDLRSQSLGFRYLVALRWSLTQLQGTSEVFPRTSSERLFSVVVIPVSLVVVSLFISYTTNMLYGHHAFSRDTIAQRWALRAYVRRHQIGMDISVRIMRFIEDEALVRADREQERQLLELLPTNLARDLMLEVRGSVVTNHPLFLMMHEKFQRFFRHLGNEALLNEHVHTEDVVFGEGDACSCMRFVAQGVFKYKLGERFANLPRSSSQFDFIPRRLSGLKLEDGADSVMPGQWMSEAALWTLWENCGELSAIRDGTLLRLPAEAFQTIVLQYQEVRWSCTLYARQFILNIQKTGHTDMMKPAPMNTWDPEDTGENVEGRNCEVAPALPLETELRQHIDPQVCRIVFCLAKDIAVNGLDEKRPHHGFTIIVGNAAELDFCGKSGFNPFQGHNLHLINDYGEPNMDVIDMLRRNAFHGDGAIVIDGQTGRVVAAGWFVSDISLGGMAGGARSRAAKAVAQQAGGCYVVKCSEDSHGELAIYYDGRATTYGSALSQLLEDEHTHEHSVSRNGLVLEESSHHGLPSHLIHAHH